MKTRTVLVLVVALIALSPLVHALEVADFSTIRITRLAVDNVTVGAWSHSDSFGDNKHVSCHAETFDATKHRLVVNVSTGLDPVWEASATFDDLVLKSTKTCTVAASSATHFAVAYEKVNDAECANDADSCLGIAFTSNGGNNWLFFTLDADTNAGLTPTICSPKEEGVYYIAEIDDGADELELWTTNNNFAETNSRSLELGTDLTLGDCDALGNTMFLAARDASLLSCQFIAASDEEGVIGQIVTVGTGRDCRTKTRDGQNIIVSRSDNADGDLFIARSQDGGETWADILTIVSNAGRSFSSIVYRDDDIGIGYTSLHADNDLSFTYSLTQGDSWVNLESIYAEAGVEVGYQPSMVELSGQGYGILSTSTTGNVYWTTAQEDPSIGEEAVFEAPELSQGFKDFASGLGFKTRQSQLFLTLVLVALSMVITASTIKMVSSGKTKNVVLVSVAFLVASSCVLLTYLDVWMIVLASVLGGFATFGRDFVSNTFTESLKRTGRSPRSNDDGIQAPEFPSTGSEHMEVEIVHEGEA